MIEIQPINRDGLYETALFLDKCWQAEYRGIVRDDFLDNMKIQDRYDGLLKRFDDGDSYFLAMYDEQKMIGVSVFGKSYIEGYEGDGEIMAIYLDSAYIGKGYGHMLFAKMEEVLIEKDYKAFVLDVLSDNLRAIGFYLKHGYEKVADRNITLGDKDYALSVMRKTV